MILVAVIWTFIFFVFSILGVSIVTIVRRITRTSGGTINFDEYFFIGFLSLSALSAILSIWFPVNDILLIIVTISSVVLFLVNREEIIFIFKTDFAKFFGTKPLGAFLIIMIIIFMLTMVVHKVIWYDTALYHAQSIQWIRKYPVVPGLGNIHGRLALNSMFMVISGLFTFHIKDVLIFPLNGICYTVFVLKLYILFRTCASNSIWKAVLYSATFLISLLMIIPFLNSTSPDIMCGILVMYTFITLISQSEESDQSGYIKTILLSLVTFTCVTYKISSLFLVLVLLINIKADFLKKSLIIVVIGILILTPYLIRNYYLSGYLIYPFPSIDIFNVDWKIPFEKALMEKSWIVSWARMPGVPYKEVINLKIFEWLIPWYKSNDFNDKLMLIVNSLSLFTFVAMLFKKEFFYAKLQAVIFINLIFWFLMAPDLRFAYGFLFIGFSFTIAYWIKLLIHWHVPINLRYLKLIILCFFLVVTGRRISVPLEVLKHPSLCIISAPFESIETKTLVSDFNYTMPVSDDRCFYSEIPCVPFPLDNVHLRGTDLKDGFRVTKQFDGK